MGKCVAIYRRWDRSIKVRAGLRVPPVVNSFHIVTLNQEQKWPLMQPVSHQTSEGVAHTANPDLRISQPNHFLQPFSHQNPPLFPVRRFPPGLLS